MWPTINHKVVKLHSRVWWNFQQAHCERFPAESASEKVKQHFEIGEQWTLAKLHGKRWIISYVTCTHGHHPAGRWRVRQTPSIRQETTVANCCYINFILANSRPNRTGVDRTNSTCRMMPRDVSDKPNADDRVSKRTLFKVIAKMKVTQYLIQCRKSVVIYAFW